MRLSSSVASKLRISRCGFTITRSPAACALRTSAPRSRKPKWRSGLAKTGSSSPRWSGSQVWIETQVTPREARRRKDAAPASERPSLIHQDTPRRKPGARAGQGGAATRGAAPRAGGDPGSAADLVRGPGRRRSAPRQRRRSGGPAQRGRGTSAARRGQGLGRLERRAGVAVGERLGEHRLRLGPAGLRQRAEQPGPERRVVAGRLASSRRGGGDEGRVVAVGLLARDLAAVGQAHGGARRHRSDGRAGPVEPRSSAASRSSGPRRRRGAGQQGESRQRAAATAGRPRGESHSAKDDTLRPNVLPSPRPRSACAQLRWYLESLVEGGRQLRRIAVHPLPFRVGRLPGLALTLASESVSKEHAELFLARGRASRARPREQERHLREQRARRRGAAARGRHPRTSRRSSSGSGGRRSTRRRSRPSSPSTVSLGDLKLPEQFVEGTRELPAAAARAAGDLGLPADREPAERDARRLRGARARAAPAPAGGARSTSSGSRPGSGRRRSSASSSARRPSSSCG